MKKSIHLLSLILFLLTFLAGCGGGEQSKAEEEDFESNIHTSDGANPHFDGCTQREGGEQRFFRWRHRSLFTAGDTGQSTSIAPGSVNISYYNVTTADLMHTSDATGEWIEEIVDSGGDVGQGSVQAIDAGGFVHIAYFDATSGMLKYATNTTGPWTFVFVDAIGTGEYNISIALDLAGNVHLSYFDISGNLRYATNQSGAWVMVTVINVPGVTYGSAIDLDSSDNVYISYAIDNRPAYITNATGPWTNPQLTVMTEFLDLIVYPNTDIAIDTLDNIHIAYAA
ncbi:MAG: hypothetical protein V3T30_00715, partial [Thermodesulfobacteriota bacterium]